MLQSLCQLQLDQKPVDIAFHPVDDSLWVLYSDGTLHSYTVFGRLDTVYKLGIAPVAFKIHPQGTLMAFLSSGSLTLYDAWHQRLKTVPVDSQSRRMAFYKNCTVVSGYLKTVQIIKPSGDLLNTLACEHLIRQLTVVPGTGDLVVYNEAMQLQVITIDGEIKWYLEHQNLRSAIHVADQGQVGYFLRYPEEFIQFDISGDRFFEIKTPAPVRQFALSHQGEALLVLDAKDQLTCYDHQGGAEWSAPAPQKVTDLRISPKGGYFILLDPDLVLTCYASAAKKETGDFFELDTERRITNKIADWRVCPCQGVRSGENQMLTKVADGRGVGLIGLDQRLHVLDRHGRTRFNTDFPAKPESLVVNPDFSMGAAYGQQQVLFMDFQHQSTLFIILEEPASAGPVFNFPLRRVYVCTAGRMLHIYDFEGNLLDAKTLGHDYQHGFSCGALGILLASADRITRFDPLGSPQSTWFFKAPVLQAPLVAKTESGYQVVGQSRDNALFVIDLQSGGQLHKSVAPSDVRTRLVSLSPLLATVGDVEVWRLDETLTPLAKFPILSGHNLFFSTPLQFYEIECRQDRVLGFENQKISWRFEADAIIKDAVLTRHGLVIMTAEALMYIALAVAEHSIAGTIADFLEF